MTAVDEIKIGGMGASRRRVEDNRFIRGKGNYVDDIVLTASSPELLRRIISCLQREFAMKDLGTLHHFLGITVERRSPGMFLPQRQYIVDVLDRAGMADCKPCATQVDMQGKLSAAAPRSPIQPATGVLSGPFSTSSSPGPTSPTPSSRCACICTLRGSPTSPLSSYLRGSLDYDLLLRPSPTSELVVYTDADWAGCPDTRRSTSGYAVFLGANLVSWAAKRQPVVSLQR